MKITGSEYEQEIFQFLDQLKELLSPKIWENILLDCSKNELLILWLLYRHQDVNMTQAADYIHVPLNTATGIVARMEKKGLIIRERNSGDKRVVTIRMDKQGSSQMQDVIGELVRYGSRVVEEFSQDEMKLLLRMMQKLAAILQEEKEKDTDRETGKKKIRKITIE